MTPRELAICNAFHNVSFPPATLQKRFAKDMMFLATHSPEKALTQKQADYLSKLAYRYRRQMPAQLAYPVIDDGSWMAAQGYEGTNQQQIERPVALGRVKKLKALPPPSPQQELPL